MNNTITIIGGGISGITTALSLQLMGFRTICYAEHLVEKQTPPDPRFASLYPAASVIPHSVQSRSLSGLFEKSLGVFGELFKINFPGVTQHRHFELYEFPIEEPNYTSFQKNYVPVHGAPTPKLPHRPQAEQLHGWAFDCYVAECPQYIHQLYQLYEQAGGSIEQQKMDADAIHALPSDIIINCTGIWSRTLFKDSTEPSVIRGHLLRLPNRKPVTDHQGRICSYNYTPAPSVYATPQGEACDVYFYPIGNQYVLGGSRQRGILNAQGEWEGKSHEQSTLIDGLHVPAQILRLHKAILKNTYQLEIDSVDELKAFMGYRFSRQNTDDGLRLDTSNEYGKHIIHNYGHGGAGVTLSWGCALQVISMLKKEYLSLPAISQQIANPVLKNLQTILKTYI